MADVFTLTSDAIPASAKVLGFRGREAISTPFRFDIALRTPPGVEVDLAGAVGAAASLAIHHQPGSPPQTTNGVIAAAELAYEFADHAVFVLTLTPRLARLDLARHSRVFTELSVVGILTEVLKASGFGAEDLHFELSKHYPLRHQTTQYQESNLAFISRLMEREGIYYFFRHEGERDILVIGDHKSVHAPSRVDPVKYAAMNPGDATGQEAFGKLRCRISAIPGKHTERDYDYLRPKLDIRATVVADPHTGEQVVVWGQTAKTVDGAKHHAQVEAEALRVKQAHFTGWGRVFDLSAGFTFQVEDHPRAAFNTEYLAIEVRHEGNDSGGAKDIEELLSLNPKELYLVHVEAIPHSLQYRSARRTHWPRIDGIVEGIVDGPAESPYAQIDEHGRYHVRIFFDESGLPDGHASMWVRMIQPHGGNPEGFHFPLRKGTEVAILFLGGDPDRPAIVGAVPNPLHPSVVTSANNSQNVVMTGGSNRLEMEDRAGGQYVTLSSPTLNSFLHLGAGRYNFVGSTEGNGFNHFGQNLDVEVLADKTEEVRGTLRETFHDTSYTTVYGATDKEYRDTFDMTVTGRANYLYKNWLITTVNAGMRLHVLQTYDESVDGAVTQQYGSQSQDVKGPVVQVLRGGRSVTVTGNDHLKVTAAHEIVAGSQSMDIAGQQVIHAGTQTFNIDGVQELNVGGHKTNTKGPWVVYSGPMFEGWSDGDFKLTAAGGSGLVSAHATLNLQASSQIVATAVNIEIAAGATVNITGGGVVNISGATVKLNC
ncbi:MAG: type VI secretion system tip protein TssI/VgrG [Polyangiaceae bacterium]